MAISEETTIDYFNWKKKRALLYWPFAEYSRWNCHLQLVLYSLLLFFVWNDLSRIFAWFSTRKNEGISYGSPVLFQVKGRRCVLLAGINLKCDDICDAVWRRWCFLVPCSQDPRPRKLQPWSPDRRAAHHASRGHRSRQECLARPGLVFAQGCCQSPETPRSPTLHLRPDAVGLKFLPGVKWSWTASYRYKKSSEPPRCAFLLPVRSEIGGMASNFSSASAWVSQCLH